MILDTNALSAWAEGRESIRHPLLEADMLVVPAIVLGEYLSGIARSRHRDEYVSWLRRYLPLSRLASVTSRTARHYADIRRTLHSAGAPIPANDAWIAALVRQHDMPLLSNDAHFDRVADLERIPF